MWQFIYVENELDDIKKSAWKEYLPVYQNRP